MNFVPPRSRPLIRLQGQQPGHPSPDSCPANDTEKALPGNVSSEGVKKEPFIVLAELLSHVVERLANVEATLAVLVDQKTVKDWYSTAEVAKLLGKAEFTVREWCRFHRIHAQKRPCGRGLSKEWMVSHAELQRIRNEGLLPLPED